MSSAYGSSVVKPTPLKNVSELLPMQYTTKDNNCVTVNMVDRTNETELLVIHEMLNHEIRQGNSYPQEHELDRQGFENYFLSADAFIVRNQTNNVVGCFYIKPNFPGRCGHTCNGGFIVHKDARANGIGKIMALAFQILAPTLGYRASMFNLVFENNKASVALWDSLNFQRLGVIPNAGRLKKKDSTDEEYVNAIMFYKDFYHKSN